MPLFEYKCTKCGYETEVKHGIFEEVNLCCPRCGGGVKQLISPPSTVYVRKRWTATDDGRAVEID
jgi:putative FmdB family regulatory protein